MFSFFKDNKLRNAGGIGMEKCKYKRVMLKISGEALAGEKGFGFDFDNVSRIAKE